MMGKIAVRRVSAIALSAALGSGTLEGCNKPSAPAAPNPSTSLALPLTTGDATPGTPAPAVTDLPPAPRPRIVRVRDPADRYAYVDQAYAMSRAIGRAPPDYGFDYQGARPWAWRTSANALRLVEPIDGGYRDYYYQPGATEPYLVRDPHYSYGFADGQLVTVYGDDGRVLGPDEIDRQADWAGRYLERGRALYDASVRNARRSVIAANWQARRDAIDAERERWAAEQDRDDDWRAYHAQHQADEEAYWQGERDRRERYAQGYDSWSRRSFQGPPPPAYSWSPGPQPGDGGGGILPALVGAGAVGGLLAVFAQGRHDDRGGRHEQTQPSPQSGTADQARAQQAQFDAARQAQAQTQAQSQAQDQIRARETAMQQGRQQQQQADASRVAAEQAQQHAIQQARQQQQQADAGRVVAQQAQQRAQQQAITQAQRQQQQAEAGRIAAQQAQQRAQQQLADAERHAQQQGAADAERRQAQAAAAARAGQQAQAQAQQARSQAQAQQAAARYAQLQAQAASRASQARAAEAQASARAAQASTARNAQAAQTAQAQAAHARAGADPGRHPHEGAPNDRR